MINMLSGLRTSDWLIRNASLSLVSCFCLVVLVSGCSQPAPIAPIAATSPAETSSASENATIAQVSSRRKQSKYLQRLSEYNLFQGALANLDPSQGTIEYDVNTPLFSDYSAKQRVIRMPEGTSAKYDSKDVFEFPVGTIIAKTFYYDHDMTNKARGRRLIETRILQHTADGWIGLPYVWNEEQSEATLSLAGASVEVTWVHHDGSARSNTHLVPNLNDCKRCHQNETMSPLGPTARNLNRDMSYPHGQENQISYWTRMALLSDAQKPNDAPKLAVWDNPETGSLDQRARAWLEVNCSHCHNPKGPARNSGLHLTADVTDPYQLGVFKTPVAAAKGTGGRSYGIVPGKPDDSILLYRLETDQAGALMPEFGRSLPHPESIALVREWIATMPE